MLLSCFGFGRGLVQFCRSFWGIDVFPMSPLTPTEGLKQQRFQLVCQDRNLRIMMTNVSGKKKRNVKVLVSRDASLSERLCTKVYWWVR